MSISEAIFWEGMEGRQEVRFWKSPGDADFARRGQGTGLRVQRSSKSRACLDGRIMRFAWRWPGDRPHVGVRILFERHKRRVWMAVDVGISSVRAGAICYWVCLACETCVEQSWKS